MGTTVICEECGKKYIIPQEKLDKIPGDVVRTKCRHCSHVLIINKPSRQAAEDGYEILELGEDSEMPPGSESRGAGHMQPPSAPSPPPADTRSKAKGFGLRATMIILFLLIPLVLMSISAYFSQRQLNKLATYISTESSQALRQQSEDGLRLVTRSIAEQCRIYLDAHPHLPPEDFATDPEFGAIAVQYVADALQTFIYEVPEEGGVWRIWAHANTALVGRDIETFLKQTLGPDFDPFWQVFAAPGASGNEASGTVNWRDRDGQVRPQYLVSVPLEGSRFVVAGTAFEDDLTRNSSALQQEAHRLALATRNTNYSILVSAVVIVLVVVTVYSRRLTRSITHLTEVADRISVGELDAEITITSQDEIGKLADAISRMQASLRSSIERLRRRC
jgi:HAMP domain-containing protein